MASLAGGVVPASMGCGAGTVVSLAGGVVTVVACSGSGAVVAASGNGDETTRLSIYGRVPIQKAVPAGQYLDALTVSVTF